MDTAVIAMIAAVLGAGGIAGVVGTIASNIRAARRGVAQREDKREADIIAARNQALADAAAAELVADRERRRRIQMEEHAARQRIKLINAGIEPDPWPGQGLDSKDSQ